ncbi:hypothetical protein ZIOFF_027873 [Zingiber officinale]|uniref:Myb-like domain-containing protein n=1 Tax=Zingiber officinale TaxID=94328 RepID=A0A8J5GU33_ZINOF|nr:hypothetical protein ZIOFF_027873 [Zingiber officinale]
MSEGTEHSSSLALLHHRHHLPQQQQHQQPPPASPSVAGAIVRGYRKGNWTLHETLILITAKRLDDDRRTGGSSSSSSAHCSPSASVSATAAVVPRSAEQRWKWVENYCWRNGCLRSQNQCNDKWDNLLRDYKKVRGYEARADASAGELPSYWAMERHERKERNLPTNLAAEVFEALTDVLGRRTARRANAAATPVSSLPPPPPPLPSPPRLPQAPLNPTAPPSVQAPAPPPAPPAHPSASVAAPDAVEMSSDSSESEENDDGAGTAEPEAKRRRLGSSVVRSATVLARTLLSCEEKREQRHREMVEIEERRLRLEEERTEIRRQEFAGLISAVNDLSSAIHSLVANQRNGDHR